MARPSDRFQSGLLVLFVLLALAGLPFAASLGSETYARQQVQSAQELKERTPATATLLVDAPPLVGNSRAAVSADPQPTDATLGPRGRHRADRSGRRRPRCGQRFDGVDLGGPRRVTLSSGRSPRRLPPSTASSLSVGLWVGLLIALAFVYQVIAYVLDHFRYAQWQREWFHVVDPSLGSNNSGEGERS